ncbi:hypothetical protein B1J92_D01122g [Nakaseomyces glabratus]|nr:hypothetical protein B1J91_D01122g [Nakaseomyces glabratus]OXB49867.1 hypothetical protein B1J92_D01122g [Nakaseomyces glabratus]
MSTMLWVVVAAVLLFVLPVVRVPMLDLTRRNIIRWQRGGIQKYTTRYYGFFHPYCNAGGGGEKVLWKAVQETLLYDPNCSIVIYTGDVDSSPKEIIANVIKRFDYEMDFNRVQFVFLKYRKWVDGSTWKHLTLVGQAIGSMLLTIEALLRFVPDIWLDTMGYPFGYPVVRWLAGLPVMTYTHYPVISSDMIHKIEIENQKQPSKKGTLKLIYWKLFMKWYQYVGKFVDVAITNSTWTGNHIRSIWKRVKVKVMYPPCSTEKLVKNSSPTAYETRQNQAVLIAQFRPEKRHKLVIQAYSDFISRTASKDHFKLVLIGSTRSEEDRAYVETLKSWAFDTLKLPKESLTFKTDCSYDDIKKFLAESTFGINAMWNEHFGIAVVEYAAAGLISLVHASAGPLLDIIVPWDSAKKQQLPYSDSTKDTRTGLFFKDKSDPDYKPTDAQFNNYGSLADIFEEANSLSISERQQISERAKECASNKFSDNTFNHAWDHALDELEHKTSRLGSN